MKAVLISIQPKWCELIASGKKTVEVRKTRPKIDVPFKCYIYCTHNNRKHALHTYINSGYGRKEFGVIGNWRSGKNVVDVNPHLSAYRYNAYLAEGKVIGEFVCDEIITAGYGEYYKIPYLESQVDALDLMDYADGKNVYGWHISDLIIYDEPKELSEFVTALSDKDIRCKHIQMRYTLNGIRYFKCTLQNCVCEFRRLGHQTDCDGYEMLNPSKPITRPPQSWCYVEERSDK